MDMNDMHAIADQPWSKDPDQRPISERPVGKLPELAAPYDPATAVPLPEGYAKFAAAAGIRDDLQKVAGVQPGQITEAAVAEIAELISANPAEVDYAAIEARMVELGLKAEDFMPPPNLDALRDQVDKSLDEAIEHWEQKVKQPRYLHVSVRVGMDEYGRPTRSAKGATARLKDADPFKPSEKLSKRQARKLRKVLAAKLRAIQADDLKFIE